jgi:sugar phosphate isomerase/epimerase
MPTRRDFLRLSALAAAAGFHLPATAYASGSKLLYGVQLYTMRKELAADFPGLLRDLRQIGFTQLELNQLAFTQPAATLRQMIEDAGLASPSSHISGDPTPRLDYARQLGLKYIVTMLPNPKPTSLDDYRAVAAKFNLWGASVRDQGIEYVFLSHGHEFLPQEGSTGFDELMKNTDPALIKLEVDIYWLVQAGIDPAAFLSRYRDRIRLLHIKDRTADAATSYAADVTAEHFTELGKGNIPWPALLRQARHQGIRYVFIDQDRTEMPAVESVRQSFAYLRKLNL